MISGRGEIMSKIVCTSCGYVGHAARITKGSLGVEVLLWIVFLVPGLIYSIWRLTSRYDGCPKCKQTTIIPLDSPMGKKFLSENLPGRLEEVEQDSLAYRLGKAARRISKH